METRKQETYPVILTVAACLVLIICAKGKSGLMTPIDLAVVMAGLCGVLAWRALAKPVLIAVSALIGGALYGVAGLFVTNYDLLLTAGGAAVIILTAVYMRASGRLDHESLIFLIFAAGFWIMFCYAQYTDTWLRQNDVGDFLEDQFDPHHAGYIDYIRRYGWLPNADVRTMDQWYHPPLHHIICAYFMRGYGTVFPSLTRNYEVLQMLTLGYSFLASLFMFRIIKMFDIPEEGETTAAFFLAFFPIFIINAGELNNDILSVMLFVMSVYYIFRWYREDHKTRFIAGCAFAIGLGMMTKLSVWMAAVPVGIILLAALIKARGRDIKLWGQYLLFALISFPLGLWFPIRNYIGWGVPPTYIPVPLYNYSLDEYSVFQRLFDVIDNGGYYNIPYYAVWSAVFDDDDYRAHAFWGVLSFAVFAVFAILVIIAAAGIIYMMIRTVKTKKHIWETSALVMMVITELTSYTVFCFKYPYPCTMNFRYIIPVTVTFLLGYVTLTGRVGESRDFRMIYRLLRSAVVVFAVLSAVFYLTLWAYDLWCVQNLV